MKRSNRGTRWLAALAALAVIGYASLASSVLLATGNGRDTNNCVQACNVFRDGCRDVCTATCGIVYPPGSPEYQECHRVCVDECTFELQFCKAKCNSGRRFVVSGEEP